MALSVWPIDKMQSGDQRQCEQRTMPGVKYEFVTPFTDGMNVALGRDGLLALINSGALRDALYMTTKLLISIGQGVAMADRPSQNSPHSFEIWACRFQLMMALRMHAQLADELGPFGELDAADLHFQYYQQFAGQTGSMVPFSLRLVHAESPSFGSSPYSAIQRAHRLEENTKCAIELARPIVVSSSEATELAIWQQRLWEVKMLRFRVLFRLNEFQKAFEYGEHIFADESIEIEKKFKMLAMLQRLAMHVGDEHRLAKYGKDLDASRYTDPMSSSLKSIFDGNYEPALLELQALKAQTPQSSTDPILCNNESVCVLYSGKAVECLQQLFNHSGAISEPLALNVATIADLVSTNSQSLKQSYLARHSADRNDLFDSQLMRM